MAEQSIFSLDFPLDDIAVITIDDPRKSVNILSRDALATFAALLDEVESRGDLAGLIIRSAKRGNFIAGANLREFVADIDQPKDKVIALCRRGQQLFGRLAQLPFVTVAAIEGLCIGGGAELAIWCDRRLMARGNASFGFPEVKLGLFPGWGGTARTPRIVGLYNAIEMATSGENVDAAAAEAMGLAISVPADKLLDAAIRVARAGQESQQFARDRAAWSEPITISDTELAFLGATASAYIQQQTKGHYPAPLAALELMLGAASADLNTACRMEAEEFVKLFGSPVNRALLNVFFLQDANKKQTGPPGAQARKIERVGVLGAGTMGQGIAAASAKHKIPVILSDMSGEAITRGVQGVITEVSYNRETKGPDARKSLEYLPFVTGTQSYSDLEDADLVIEAVFENVEVKRELFAEIEPQLSEQSLLCSNTSTIPITTLAHGLTHPERFCGLHFFNPVRRMPLVEVIRGKQTSDDTVATAVAYTKALGKSPIVVNDGPGFLVNRVLLPYMNEALLLVEEGATLREIDKAATGFGMPMGPLELYDTVGLDVALHAGTVMHNAFPDRVVPSKILPDMVDAKRLGQKRGKGFFDYPADSKGKTKPAPSDDAQQIINKHQSGVRNPQSAINFIDRLFLPMLLEATRIIEEGIVIDVRDVDLALIYGIGFPPFKGGLFFWADSIGAAAIVEKLQQYHALGDRYKPTALLTEHATSGEKFYERQVGR